MLKTLFSSRRRRAYTFVANQPVESFRGMTLHQIEDAVQAHTIFVHALVAHLGHKPRRLTGLTRPGAISASFTLRLDRDAQVADFLASAEAILGDSGNIRLFEPDKASQTIAALFSGMNHGRARAVAQASAPAPSSSD